MKVYYDKSSATASDWFLDSFEHKRPAVIRREYLEFFTKSCVEEKGVRKLFKGKFRIAKGDKNGKFS